MSGGHTGRRTWIGAGLAVVALAGGIVAATQLRDGTGPGSAGHASSLPSGPPVDVRRLALGAPCGGLDRTPHLAGRDEVARFHAVAIVQCRTVERAYAGEGLWQVQIREVATKGLARVMTALEAKDEPAPGPGVACAAIGYGPLPIVLAAADGTYLHPRAPQTACGAPQPAVEQALHSLAWKRVGLKRVQQDATEPAVKSGCEMQWKNENALEPGGRPANGQAVLALHPDAPLRACLYRTGSDAQVGGFSRAVTLTGKQGTELRAALAGPGRIGTCAAQKQFAVIFAGGPYVDVELGGCWRVVRADLNPQLAGTAEPAAVRSLLGLPTDRPSDGSGLGGGELPH